MGSYNYYRMFGCFSRKFKINEAEPPPDVKGAFLNYAEKGTNMMADQFLKFLVDFQGEKDMTLADAERIMQHVHNTKHHLTKNIRKGLSMDDFVHFLLQDDLNGPIKTEVHHDMTAPLHHYFIYTGHNSYLTGNQLSSACSETPIIKALQRGVRGIELDIWPNSTKDNIHVLHGRTLTTPVPLIKCFKAIEQHAFVRSGYPVIITLEDHLTPDLQAKVAEMAIQIFGDMLYYPDSGSLEKFPSPEELKQRIILSTKPPKEYLETKDKVRRTESFESEDDLLVKELSEAELEPDEKCESNGTNEDANGDNCDRPPSEKPCQLVAPEYKRLITIHAGKPKQGLKHALITGTDKITRLSLSEQALQKAATSHGTDLVRFTQKNILRIYPKGTRVTSTNFKPLTGWMHGAQMVAFNMQGHGKSLRLMHGMFRSNGGCGYVKKPDFLMTSGPNNEVFDPKVALPVKTTLKVNVYLGEGWRLDFSHTHFDAYSPPDFYTKVHIVGVPADVSKKRTRIIEDDWGPQWDEEFKFRLTVPELALLRIVVREYDLSEKDDFGGQTCLPVSELRPGIRSVPLYDKKGEKLKSVKLLMRFQFL
ncbi:hypothetical protein Leryth_023102 [Lithospermum erythrorhizon]|nr:hypothetical protein Leryth_023102 [Lithospermum erythrorhizon]